MSDLNAPPDSADVNLKGKSSNKIIFVVVGLLLIGGGITLAAMRLSASHEEAKKHAAFMERFANLENKDAGAFWACIFGNNTDPGSFADNIQLGNRITGAYAADPMHYPEKVVETCAPKLDDTAKRMSSLDPHADYDAALAKYKKSLESLKEGIVAWAERAKTYAGEREFERKLEAAGSTFHAGGEQPKPEAIAYARFLRCAIPGVDKMKDAQPIVEFLYEGCKKPEFWGGIIEKCQKTITEPDPKPDKEFKSYDKRFAGDDRDTKAIFACFKNKRKETKRDDMAQFGMAWKDYMEASSDVRKIGAAHLKKE